ncbi:MAG: leucine-rich repeat domain-containing protein, partial [Paramuribaculum sp.]|nr:leucine-rich repeat domain-containing protein [Paramuribaculum sp.]
LQTVNISNSVTYIGGYVFRDCSALKDIKLSDKLSSIQYGLFSGCKELTKIDIPGSINWISQHCYSDYTFYNCNNLTKLSILYSPESLKVGYTDNLLDKFYSSIWLDWTNTITDLYLDRALGDNIPVPNLERLELGESLQKVQIKDIKNLHKLKVIVCHALVPPTLQDMSNAQYMNVEVLVPEEAIDAYRAAPNWKTFWNLKGFAGIEENIMHDTKQIVNRVSLTGYPVEENYHGIVIIRYSDGSAKKVLQ